MVLDIHAHTALTGLFVYGNSYDDVYRSFFFTSIFGEITKLCIFNIAAWRCSSIQTFFPLKRMIFYWSLISSFIFDPWILIFDPGFFIIILRLNIDPWPRYERHIVFPKVLAQNCDDFNCNNTIYNADQKKSGSVRRHMTSYLSHEVKISLTPKISLTR